VGRKVQIAIIALVIALLAGAVGAYAYDSSRSDRIAEGVRVAGVDVGGLDREEAVQLLRKRVVKPLKRPVTVEFEGSDYQLGADELKVRADIDGMVDRAVEASRSGILPERLWRYATGGEVNERVPSKITYSTEAVDGLLSEVSAAIDRDPVDASVDPGPSSLGTVEAQPGRTVRTGALRERLERAVHSPNGRTVSAPVERVQPEVTKADLADEYPTYLTVDRGNFQLRLWRNLEVAKTYTIAVGQAGYDTPAGVYNIQNKAVNPAWHVPDSDWAGDLAGTVVPPGPDNPIKSRWMGIYDGAGIHGTDDVGSLGTAASHGCLRMSIPEVQELYEQVDVGTPVYIGN
jgi:lipoprotein-anchoring transpeptidase ErfK/SrfK